MKNVAKNNYAENSGEKMETVGDRLLIFINKTGLSRSDIAKEAGVVFSTVSNYLEKDELPGPKFLSHLVRRHRINVDWLLSGSGPMTIDELGMECRSLAPDGHLDPELEIMDLRRKLTEKDREFARYILEAAKAADDARRWRDKVLSAVALVARSQGLTSDQHRAMVDAVIDPLRAISELDSAPSHQTAAGE